MTAVPSRVARASAGLRRGALALVIALILQYVFGIWVTLFCSVPTSRHSGLSAAVVRAIGQGSTVLAIHTVLGLLIVLMALSMVIRAAMARDWFFAVISVLGLGMVIGAAANGASFVNTATRMNSMVMAMLWAATLLLFVLALFVRSRGPRGG